MHGNVWEWCLDDWHDNYEGALTDGSAWFDENNNLSQKTGRAVLRGGSCSGSPGNCRSAYRDNCYGRVNISTTALLVFVLFASLGGLFNNPLYFSPFSLYSFLFVAFWRLEFLWEK